MARRNNGMLRMSRVAPKPQKEDKPDLGGRITYKQNKDRKGFDILMEAKHYWDSMAKFRSDRERNKRYTYGDQWGDIVCVGGKRMTEAQYIMKQGSVPLTNNLIRRLVRNVLGVYRNQSKEPTCVARDRDEQKLGETMSSILQCNMQLNRANIINARTMEEFLIGALVMQRKSYGWRNGKLDCWTDYVNPACAIVDNNMRDFRGWDATAIGEIHDISFGNLCEQFAETPQEYEALKKIYFNQANHKEVLSSYASEFGYDEIKNFDFLCTSDPSRCRVIEFWRKEQLPRYRCHDYQTGNIYKIDIEDYDAEVTQVNNERLQMAESLGMPTDEVPLVEATWFVDDAWFFYYLSPFGDILKHGESPYDHKSHPYVALAYPFIDGEVHSFVADVIDQQRYVNRLITMYDWIMRSSAKGVLLVPKDCIPDGMSAEDFAESWTEYNGVVVYEPSKTGAVPTQIASNSTNIGINELLNVQLKFFEDISGVNGALQGKPGYAGESAAHFSQQAENATRSLIDLLECFSDFVKDGAYKDVKNIQQFYDDKRVFNIAGKNAVIEYDPEKIRDVEFDLSIVESTSTPAYRMLANDILMQLFNAQAITVEQLLEQGDFPFADNLLQSIRSQKESLQNGQNPNGLSPELMQQAQQGADMQAVDKLASAMRSTE